MGNETKNILLRRHNPAIASRPGSLKNTGGIMNGTLFKS